jgi:hypothetical protein
MIKGRYRPTTYPATSTHHPLPPARRKVYQWISAPSAGSIQLHLCHRAHPLLMGLADLSFRMPSFPYLGHLTVSLAVRAASIGVMALGENNCPSVWLVDSASSKLASSISMTLLVALRVLTGSWDRQMFCRRALVMLGLSCRLKIFLMDKRILSMVMVFSLKSRTATPILRKVCLPMIRLYRGALAPASYSSISGVNRTDLLAESSRKEMPNLPSFLV